MAKKFNPDNSLSPKEFAKHLRKPEGETGKQIGLQMNEGNEHISLNSYKVLNPKSGNQILEIGMGNGFFVKDLFKMTESLDYTGVDFSSIMVEEACLINEKFIDSGVARFECASIEKLPFEENYFDYIVSTNTIYFWPNLEENAKELNRVLKPNGKIVLAYRSKSCMDQIELTNYGFTKYNYQEVEKLLIQSDFREVSTQIIKEPELEFDDEILEMEGFYTCGFKV